MKKIIVTGCNGQLGRAINQELAGNTEISIVNTDVAELDITSVDEVLALVREVKPYAIINCAAHTAVDACETDLDNAYRINAIGPRNLGIAATENWISLIINNIVLGKPVNYEKINPIKYGLKMVRYYEECFI